MWKLPATRAKTAPKLVVGSVAKMRRLNALFRSELIQIFQWFFVSVRTDFWEFRA